MAVGELDEATEGWIAIATAYLDLGGVEVEPLEPEGIPEGHIGARFITEIKDLDAVSKFLAKARWKVIAAELRYVAKNCVELSEPQPAATSAAAARIGTMK